MDLPTAHGLSSLVSLGALDKLMSSTLFALTLSLLGFYIGGLIYERFGKFALFHPTITGACIVAALLPYLNIDYPTYLEGNQLLMFWLGPATVALAVPLYQQLHLIRELAKPILVTVVSGATFAAGSAVAIAYALGANETTLLSLIPKSVTTPIAVSTAQEIGGLTTLAAGAVALTAAVGMAFAPIVFRLLRINDPKIWGLCLGITAHGMGTVRAFELHPSAGAFSSLAMCLTGTFSAVVIPIAVTTAKQL
jgi:predicted murein hydrolase (TIGR00659 family)